MGVVVSQHSSPIEWTKRPIGKPLSPTCNEARKAFASGIAPHPRWWPLETAWVSVRVARHKGFGPPERHECQIDCDSLKPQSLDAPARDVLARSERNPELRAFDVHRDVLVSECVTEAHGFPDERLPRQRGVEADYQRALAFALDDDDPLTVVSQDRALGEVGAARTSITTSVPSLVWRRNRGFDASFQSSARRSTRRPRNRGSRSWPTRAVTVSIYLRDGGRAEELGARRLPRAAESRSRDERALGKDSHDRPRTRREHPSGGARVRHREKCQALDCQASAPLGSPIVHAARELRRR
jgi:hypothetical protein